jgi:hypothetical protein
MRSGMFTSPVGNGDFCIAVMRLGLAQPHLGNARRESRPRHNHHEEG